VTGLVTDSEELTANINSSFNTLLSNGCTIADVFDGVQQVLTHLISVKADAISNMQMELTAVNSRSSKRASVIQGLKEELKVETASSGNRLAAIKKLEISANVSDATISSLRKDFVTVQETASLAATASDATIKSMRKELQLIQDTASLEIVDLKNELAALSCSSAKQQERISAHVLELQSEKEVSARLVAAFNDLKVELDTKVHACADLTTSLSKAQESLSAANVSVISSQKECKILSTSNIALSEKISSMSLEMKLKTDLLQGIFIL
jgi:chromosome segregation ATPase